MGTGHEKPGGRLRKCSGCKSYLSFYKPALQIPRLFFYVQPKAYSSYMDEPNLFGKNTFILSGHIKKCPFLMTCFWVARGNPFGQFFLNTNLKQRKEFCTMNIITDVNNLTKNCWRFHQRVFTSVVVNIGTPVAIIACIVGALFCTVKAINAFHSDRGSNDFWRYIVGIAVSILGIVVFTVLWTSLASYL